MDNNKKITEKLEQEKLMTDFGRKKIEEAKQNGQWDIQKSNPLTEEHMQEFDNMLKPFDNAYANFVKMSHSVRKTYTASYFFGAKTEEGKQKRFTTIIERLDMNLNPMESMKKKHNVVQMK